MGPSVYLVGETYSADFPKLNAIDATFQGPEYFVTRIDNSDPSPPSSPAQFRTDGITPLAVGAWTTQTGMVVRAGVGDVDGDAVALQVEIRAIDVPFTGTASATGTFGTSTPREVAVTFPVPPALQQFHWRARTIDSHGRTSSWVVFGGNLDNPLPAQLDVGRDPTSDPPTVTTLTPTTGSTYTTSVSPLTFTGGASDLVSGIASVTWTNVATPLPVPSSGTATGTTSWSVPSIPLSAGTNTITFTATDLAGNTGTKVVTVTYDTSPPVTTITTPNTDPYLTGTGVGTSSPPTGIYTIFGTTTDNAQVASVSWTNSTGGSGAATFTGGTPVNRDWNASITLTPGSNLITVTSYDGANNAHSDTVTLTYDNVPPGVNVNPATLPANNTTLAAALLNLGGAASDVSNISGVLWSNNGSTPVAASLTFVSPGNWTWNVPSIPLSPGANVITIGARDGVLNEPSSLNLSTTSVTVYQDVAAPVATILNPTPSAIPPGFATGNPTIVVSGTATDDQNVVSMTWINPAALVVTPQPVALSGPVTSRTWSATVSLAAGDNFITFTATDIVGRTQSASTYIARAVDAPNLVVTNPNADTVVVATASVVVAATASANPPATSISGVSATNTTTGVVVPAVFGADWTATVNLVIGTNVINVTATDNLGTPTTVGRTVIYDPTAPAITITGPTGADSYASPTNSIVLSGVATDNRGVASVVVVSGPAAALSGPVTNRTWTTPALPLVAGVNVLTVRATDEAGNTTDDTITVTWDTSAPGITITSPTSAASTTVTTAGVALGGTASDNVSVQVVTWINSATGASGAATGTTTWSTASIPLNAGTNVITVLAVDAAGNTQTDTITVFRDLTSPTITITSPTSAPSLDTPTATISLGGTSTDDVQVSAVTWVRTPGPVSGSANGTATWSIDSIPLVAGTNTITVTATDGAARSSNDVLTVIYDPTLPTITITSPGADPFSTTSTPQTISGNAGDNLAVTSVTWTNTTTGGSGSASGSTSWTCLTPLTSGSNSIIVTARDAAGNTATDTITVVYDPAAPIVDITTPTTGISITTGITPITIGGTAGDDVGVASVTWTTSGAVATTSGTATGTTDWSFPVDLAPGENVVTVTATDGVGRTGTTFLTVIYDATPPSVTITAPTTDSNFLTVTPSVNLAGIAGDNLNLQTVTWSNAATGTGGPTVGVGSWSVTGIALNEGINAITVTATDGVGRTGSSLLTVNYDGTDPLIAIDAPNPTLLTAPGGPPYATTTRPFPITGTASDNIGLASVTWVSDRGGGGSAPVVAGAWSTSVYLVAGTNVITFTATDTHGRSSTAQISFAFTPENSAPNILIVTPAAGPGAAQTVIFSGSADDNVGIVGVTWRNRTTGVRGTAVIAVPGVNPVAWSANVPLTAGDNELEATAVDDAGNTATASITANHNPASDGIEPTVDITGPTTLDLYTSSVSPLTLTVTATDAGGIAVVRWFNEGTGGGGVGTPGTLPDEWLLDIPLAFGSNVVTVTGLDPSGNSETDTIIITFTPPPGDSTPPVVTITSHSTASTLNVSTALLSLAGTSSDNVAVTTVIWADDASGLTGSADGTTSWTVDVTLEPGINVLTLRAYDSSGLTGTSTLTVLYTPPPPPPEVVPAGSCGLLGLDAVALLALLAAFRRRRSS